MYAFEKTKRNTFFSFYYPWNPQNLSLEVTQNLFIFKYYCLSENAWSFDIFQRFLKKNHHVVILRHLIKIRYRTSFQSVLENDPWAKMKP